MARILLLEDEDEALLRKLTNNMAARATEASFTEHIMSIHRLKEQFDSGLPTPREYVYNLKAEEVEAEEDEKAKIKAKKTASKKKLAKDGITANVKTVKPRGRKAKASKKVDVSGTCDEHPNYGAKRRPRTECETCWGTFAEAHPDRYEKAYEDFLSSR